MLEKYPDVMSPEQLINVLPIGRNSVYNLLKSGEIKSIRSGRRYIIPKIYLEEYLINGYNRDSLDSEMPVHNERSSDYDR